MDVVNKYEDSKRLAQVKKIAVHKFAWLIKTMSKTKKYNRGEVKVKIKQQKYQNFDLELTST